MTRPHFHRTSWVIVGGLWICSVWVTAGLPQFWAMPSARSGGLRPEPISVVSALRAPAAIAKEARQ